MLESNNNIRSNAIRAVMLNKKAEWYKVVIELMMLTVPPSIGRANIA